MAIETDLDVSPYYDDTQNALDNNYHRILFRPSVALQARELTQLQDILQNQIERFGDNIFVEGTIIKGCNFHFDSNYYYTKILDLRPLDAQSVTPSEYVGLLAHETTSNLYAVCVNSQDGFESQDPDLKTLYFKYVNSGINNEQRFTAGTQLQFYSNTDPTYANTTNLISNGDLKIASTANAVGTGYAMSVSSGVVFQKGHFIQVANNTSTIVSKYNNAPDSVVVGFDIEENIITEYQDTTLYDSSAGSSNYNAPGAHRLQLIPNLVTYNLADVPTSNFLALVEWEEGNITKSFEKTQYSELGNELARRTYEESGNYFVKPFRLHMESANDTHNYAVTSAGLAYIEGHRVEQLNNVRIPVRKGTNLKTARNQILNTNFNNSVLVKEYLGNLPSNIGATLSLRSTAGSKVTAGGGTVSASGSEIGTAKILGVEYDSGTVGTPTCQYKVYLADIKMNPGKSFRSVKSVYYAGSPSGTADVILVLDSTTNSNVAVLSEPTKSCLIFSTAKTGLNSFADTGVLPDYTYRSLFTTTVSNTTGISSAISVLNPAIFPYAASSTLSTSQEQDLIIIPTSFGPSADLTAGGNNVLVTTAKTGNVALSANIVTNATGNTTSFTTEYQIGDYISAGSQYKRITNISNNTYLNVSSNWTTSNTGTTHNKTYPKNVPINFSNRSSTVTVSSTSRDLTLTLLTANGDPETLSNTMNLAVYTNVILPNDADRGLTVANSIVVKLNTANNVAGASGPWCLGVPYGYKLRNVYKSSNTGTFVANSTTSNSYLFTNTSSFTSGVSIFGYGIPSGATANVVNSTALILSSNATSTIANGTFSYAYYSNTASDDVTYAFTLQDGQTDAIFDQAFLAKNNNYKQSFDVTSASLLTVVFDSFVPQNTGKGYISIDSYKSLIDSDYMNFEDIPTYTSSAGITYKLRDSVDFRPFVSNTAVRQSTMAAANVNPAYTSTLPTSENYIVAPNQNFIYDSRFYVGRIDKLMLNSYGSYSVVEGIASEKPREPADKTDTMTLATINIPPYPTLVDSAFANADPDYVVSIDVTKQNRGYTMKDISKIENRLDDLEYYTSLNLLEQQASSLTIASSITGANRFKNGIFADNFSSLDNTDITNEEFKAGLSPSETALIPRLADTRIPLKYVGGANTAKQGDYITLGLGSTSLIPFITQGIGTKSRACTDIQYGYRGSITLTPNYNELPEINTTPLTPVQTDPLSGQLTAYITINNSTQGVRWRLDNTLLFEGYTNNSSYPNAFVRLLKSTSPYSLNVDNATAVLNKIFNSGLTTNRWGFVQSGLFIPPETGTYTFTFAHDDYLSASIGGAFIDVLDWDHNTPSVLNVGTLTAGKKYSFYHGVLSNGKNQTHSDFKFTVNGSTYAFPESAQFYTAGAKPINNNMFARWPIYQKPSTVTNANTQNTDSSLSNPMNLAYDNSIESSTNTAPTAPVTISIAQVNNGIPILVDSNGTLLNLSMSNISNIISNLKSLK